MVSVSISDHDNLGTSPLPEKGEGKRAGSETMPSN